MKVLLVATNMESRMLNRMNAQPLPIGLAYIAGFVDQTKHSIQLVDLMFSDDYEATVRSTIETFKPDVVGISLRNLSNHSSLDTRWAVPITQNVINIIKSERPIPVICGGPGFSALPVPCFDLIGADYGLVGDSGEAFASLINQLENNALQESATPGLVYKANGKTVYDGNVCSSSFSPRPYYEGLDLDSYNNAGFGIGILSKLTSWQYGSESMRVANPPETIINELKQLATLDNFKKVFFIDNAFNIPRESAVALCEALISENLGIHWSTILSPDNPDPELISLMKTAGCVFSMITTNSNSKAGKGSIYEVCSINNLGYSVNVSFGGIGETRESVRNKLAFLKEADATISYLRYGISVMPGTKEAEQLLSSGIIKDESELIKPHFFVEPSLEEWLLPTLSELCNQHPKWNLS